MESMLFESRDLARTEEFLNRAYTKMQIGGRATDVRTRISRAAADSISIDRIEIGFEMSYDADPLGKICLCEVTSGSITDHATDGWEDEFRPGDLVSFAPADRPFAGTIRRSTYTITMFDPVLLAQVTGAGRKDDATVRLLSHRPHSRAAAYQLSKTIAYVDHVLPNPAVRTSPLVLASLSQLLASSVLAAFPNSATTDGDGPDARPPTVRRAMAFMESNLDQPITIADIATAAGVTVRAVQTAFQRHLGTTPLAQLRLLRLAEVHSELQAADPTRHTVAEIAARWGFHHHGRMAAAYLELYGELPSTTLAR
ncbi:helix-turn-helix domain-containing protein [Kribbella jiaozuonensis]|uniref:AraC family transcriptional regulator n=1 Tax=Kribbella jiaozuonensis TaxID=2575441 RepID=A0A4U3LVT4_9ACTN|nr:AraC family transcriptional regulator [Kribbella jiaozuonensis]TKK80268.1 AraC family transcriptional regulator [Kribbella jiaozuonensis]